MRTDIEKRCQTCPKRIQRMRERGDEVNMRRFLIREAMTYITSYFDRHAQAEEAYMRRIGYDGYGMHKKLHDDFRSIQMAKYQKFIENGQCNKDDVWDFIGSGIGWLLEHIATADMAIVGKGIRHRRLCGCTGTGDQRSAHLHSEYRSERKDR